MAKAKSIEQRKKELQAKLERLTTQEQIAALKAKLKKK